MDHLSESFFIGNDVVAIAQQLLGKYLFTCFDGIQTGGIITETEAYAGITDKASHAYGGKRTGRTEVMYAKGGVAYVYLCYGIHSLFNIVTNDKDIPHAVLIRSIYPMYGIDKMGYRLGKAVGKKFLVDGPGKVSKAMGIHYSHSGTSLQSKEIWLEDRGEMVSEKDIYAGPRIGVSYAGVDAALPYRYIYKKKYKNYHGSTTQNYSKTR